MRVELKYICLLLSLLVIVFGSVGYGQAPDTLWTRAYGSPGIEEAFSVKQTSDSGYIIAGHTRVGIGSSPDVYLVKTDADGDTLWTGRYDWGESNSYYTVMQTSDGGYVVVGSHGELVIPNYDVYTVIMKTDSLGGEVWTQTFGEGNYSTDFWAYDAVQTDDGGFAVSGRLYSTTSEVLLIKTDSLGGEEWSRTYPNGSYGWSVMQTNDGGFVVVGVTSSSFPGGTNFYMVKTDANGDSIWTRSYGGDGNEKAYSVVQTDNGGYILAGYTDSFGAGAWDFYVVKTRDIGDTLWSRTYGGVANDVAYQIRQVSDGGYIMAGYEVSNVTWEYNQRVIKIDGDGEVEWGAVYGGGSDDEAYDVVQTSDGGYIVAGFTASYGAGDRDFYVVKIGPDEPSGMPLAGTDVLPIEYVLHPAYPNPFNAQATIRYDVPVNRVVGIAVFDVLGRKVVTLIDEEAGVGRYQVMWDAGDLPSGVYFVRMEAGDFRQVRKVVLLK